MYYVIGAEGLTDPLILNNMHVIGLDVIKAPGSSKFPYWYEVIAEGGPSLAYTIQEHLKPDWYVGMFTGKDVSILFHDRQFDVIVDDELTADAKAARAYGQEHGVQDEFLDWQQRQDVYLRKLAQSRGE